MPFETRTLIKEVCRLAIGQGVGQPAATRLVKILYLADLEWRRKHRGEPLSNWTWLFWHFGPYAMEFNEVFGTQAKDIELVELKTGKVAKFLNFKTEELQREVPDEVFRLLRSVVAEWAGVDINRLLDYVYFETEPMETARRGERLDFSQVVPLSAPISPEIDQKRLNGLRSALRKRVKEINLPRQLAKIPLAVSKGEEPWSEEFESVKLQENAPVRFSIDET
jgi:antitoxin SocA-like protein